jgi:DNA end-binding protein Ku
MGAMGKFVLWGKENLSLVRPLGDSLALETLYYAEDVRPRADIDDLVGEIEVQDAELAMARQLVDSLVGEFDPTDYENEYRTQLRELLEAKLEGKEISIPEPVAAAPVVDLMDALRQSVAQAQKKRAPAKTGKKAPAKRRAATRS